MCGGALSELQRTRMGWTICKRQGLWQPMGHVLYGVHLVLESEPICSLV